MRKSIRNLNNLSSGNQLRQGDESFLIYEIIADGSLVNSTARVRLYKGESVYLDVNTDIKNGNLVEFSVATLPVGQYIVEIAVNGYKYPSHEFETINIIPSTDGYAKKSESVDVGEVVNSVLKRLPEAQAEVIRTDVAWADGVRYVAGKAIKAEFDDLSNRFFRIEYGKTYLIDFNKHEWYGNQSNQRILEDSISDAKIEYNDALKVIRFEPSSDPEMPNDNIVYINDWIFPVFHMYEILPDEPLEFSGFTTEKPRNNLFPKAIGFRQTTGEVSQNPHDYNWTVLR